MDQTDTGLKAVIKALTDVVAPALDPNDPLAQEQLRLSVDYIAFVRQRIDYLHGRERFDLLHYVKIARSMQEAGVPADCSEGVFLERALAPAEVLAESPAALTHELREAAMELAHAVAAVVRSASGLPADVARKVRHIVMDATEEKLEFERLWYVPIGFEAPPATGKTLEGFLK